MQLSLDHVFTIYRRELQNYFNTPIGYIFLGIFSLLVNFLFFYLPNFWDVNAASMFQFFTWLRIVFLFFIPAITMRLWSEEKKSGTLETLFTLPLRPLEIILGKYFSALSFLGIALLTTLFVPISIEIAGNPDLMVIIGSYIGVFLLGAAYIALGIFISWHSNDQIIAFLITMAASFALFLMGYPQFMQLLGPLGPIVAYASVSWHFDSLARGLFDTRDIIYFLSFIFVFLYLNHRSILKSR